MIDTFLAWYYSRPMNRAKVVMVVAAALVLGLVLALSSGDDSGEMTDEERIQALLDKAQGLACKADRKGLLELIADDYKDDQGWTKKDLSRSLAIWFLRARNIGVHLMDERVMVNGNSARVDARAVLTRGRGLVGEVIPTDAAVYDLQVELERRDDDWLVVSHRRKRVR